MTSQKGAQARWGSNVALPRAPSPSMQPSGPNPACHTAGLAWARALTERLSANALCQHNTCAQRDKSWPRTWRRCYGDVTSMHMVYCKWHIPGGGGGHSNYFLMGVCLTKPWNGGLKSWLQAQNIGSLELHKPWNQSLGGLFRSGLKPQNTWTL